MDTQFSAKYNVLIMAAGAASRFGACKLLAPLKGKALIDYSVSAIENLPLKNIYIATGAYHAQIKSHFSIRQNNHEAGRFNILNCQSWKDGLGSAIAEACEQIAPDGPILITLADLPFVSEKDVNFLLQLAEAHPSKIVMAFNGQSLCPPAIFPDKFRSELLALNGDTGAKRLIEAYPNQLVSAYMASSAFDIDTKEQLDQANNLSQ